MIGSFEILKSALAASMVMSPVHCLFGLHIVRRGVIFIDLAVAQMAALGMSIAIARGYDHDSPVTYWLSLGFALLAALLIALTRFRLGRVPHEAIIGIVFVLASALGLIVLDGSAHGVEDIRDLLSGSILLVEPTVVKNTAIVYGAILVIALAIWRQISAISFDSEHAPRGFARVFYDFLFYGLLAFVVASSVKIAGVLVVFTWLVMPPVAALLWVSSMGAAVAIALPLAIAGSAGGMVLSAQNDWPTGPSIVVVFGAITATLYIAKLALPTRADRDR
ncbi:MAG TPA: metal ABC transporter permease [Fimbriimonadaceae bacterium]|nr:metal ABC transporter permease [Fimbriimonadaceae bacterium]